MTTQDQSNGFTLIEVIVAMMILSVGILAMGASTGHILTQIQMSELRTERVAVVRQAAETLRSADFNSVENVCAAASTTFGTEHYDLSCTVWQGAQHVKRVELISVGPGFVNGKRSAATADTFAISVSEPLP